MNTTELKKLAEAAIYNDTEALPHALTVFHNAANPAAILELLEVTKGLAEALKMVRVAAINMRGGGINLSADQWKTFHAALAKYEGV